ncbi:hypothetical protein NP493_22g02032 [Ridgeia piscesae]|uniref:Uncharacterized protein n=1 Tax=Ridgeia piscesae TaxID=27915 RepID=A0AAD9PDM8_RIDPI|nr:hypothetical protein NP493_22g02032 [Ridgeia piscesae]
MEKFCVVLERVLYQTVECLADDRWELRRMGTQDSKLCCEMVVHITDCIRRKLSVWSVSVHQQLCRPRCDQMTITALNTLTGLTGSIVQVVSGVFCAAHPDVDLTKQLLARLCPGWITTIVPFDGFLRCEQNRNLNVSVCFKQVENLMLSELCTTLPTFIGVCPPEDRRSKMEEFVGLALRQLADIIRHGLVDVSTTRQVVDLYLSLSGQLDTARHVHIILAALAHRLAQINEVKSTDDMVRSRSGADLAMNSNDIPISPEAEEQEASTDEDDPPLDTSHTSVLAECHTLNTSNNSGSGSRHLEQRILFTVISEFLVKLKQQMTSDVKDKDVFERHLRKMSPSERRHLVDILATNESC